MNPEKNHILEQKIILLAGGSAAIVQLFSILIIMITIPLFGLRPETIEEFFTLYSQNRLEAILRDDFSSLVIIAMYLFTFPAMYMILKRTYPLISAFIIIGVLIAVTICFSGHSGLSLVFLSEQFANATSDLDRLRLMAAGEAILAGDMWHSSAGFISGILLQGAGVVFSLIMLRTSSFSKVTAYSGLVGNSFDLIQHLFHSVIPDLSTYAMVVAGPAYIIWFIMLARDLIKNSKAE